MTIGSVCLLGIHVESDTHRLERFFGEQLVGLFEDDAFGLAKAFRTLETHQDVFDIKSAHSGYGRIFRSYDPGSENLSQPTCQTGGGFVEGVAVAVA